jgi:hypothetical protein
MYRRINKKFYLIASILLTSFGTFLISCECRGIKENCFNSDRVAIRFLAKQPIYNDVDTLKTNKLTIEAYLYQSDLIETTFGGIGVINARCLGCFDYLTSYSLVCKNNFISSYKDTIKAGINLLLRKEFKPYFDWNFGTIDVDETYKLPSGVNEFLFTAEFNGKSLTIKDTLIVDSAFGY